MIHLLLIHGSRFGHSTAILEHVASNLRAPDVRCTVIAARDAQQVDPSAFDGVVVTASVQYGFIDKRVRKWVVRNLATLQKLPTLLVTVSLTARKYVDKPVPATEHSYTKKFLDATGWEPSIIELAAGKLEYPRYNAFDRTMIRLIMHISGGVTDGTSTIDYTNWDRLTKVAQDYRGLLPAAS